MCGDISGGFHFRDISNGWTVGKFRALDSLGSVVHGVTTRRGPTLANRESDRPAAAEQVAAAAGLREVAFCRQVHGKVILPADRGGLIGNADGLVANAASLGVMGFSADCPLILAADPVTGAVGIAHASWRGTTAGIASELVVSLADRFGANPADLVACICPGAGPCCYEVNQDVRDAASKGLGPTAGKFFASRGGKTYFDLWSANRDELIRASVKRDNVHVAGVCTICRNDLFPSFRAEGDAAGRFVCFIGQR